MSNWLLIKKYNGKQMCFSKYECSVRKSDITESELRGSVNCLSNPLNIPCMKLCLCLVVYSNQTHPFFRKASSTSFSTPLSPFQQYFDFTLFAATTIFLFLRTLEITSPWKWHLMLSPILPLQQYNASSLDLFHFSILSIVIPSRLIHGLCVSLGTLTCF